MGSFERLKLLVQLSVRSLGSHRLKTFIVGGILLLGTFILAFATTMLDNVEKAMERSITGSLIGHLQLVSKDGVDDLAFFGPNANGAQDLGVIKDFAKTREVLEKLPEVAAVVPMGRDMAQLVGEGNLLDAKLAELRHEVATNDAEHMKVLEQRIRQITEMIRKELENRKKLSSRQEEIATQLKVVERVLTDEFWAGLRADPQPNLDWLDGNLAPLQSDEQNVFVQYIGTDVERFTQEFGAFQILKGQKMAPGERGILLGQEFRERWSKQFIARELDLIKAGRDIDGKTFASDSTLKEKAARVLRQHKRVIYELGPDESVVVEKNLRGYFKADETADLNHLVERLLTLDDENFDAHYKAFYDLVTPHLRLYNLNVGDTVTLRVYTRSGYTRAANLKISGLFGFRGLDGSLIASAYNIIDIMSFRDLYGLMTPERRAELDLIKADVGVKDVSAADAEAALFGEETTTVLEAAGVEAKVDDIVVGAAKKANVAVDLKPATQADIDGGVVINAAVILKNGNKLKEGMAAIQKASDENGLDLKVIDWEAASGVIGQLIWTLRIVLYIAFLIMVIVALAIINNSLLMATINRIQEIGTFRAIGAQKFFVVGMLIVETIVLGVLACGSGLAIAGAAIGALGSNGLSARGNEMLIVLFGGPKLFPTMTAASIVISLLAVGLVSLIATLYPAFLATTVQPVVAMQKRE